MKVLVCSVGLSPQVVTETLHALHGRGWRPDRLILLTTRGGQQACERQLLAPDGGLDQFRQQINPDLPSPEFVLTPSDSGDTATERDIMAFADCANRLVGTICTDPSTTLYLLLAGGRKPAAAFLSLIMTMHGRPQDRLLHVMTQPDMVAVPDFWFPTPRRIALPQGNSLMADEVQVNLLDIPFPRSAKGPAQQIDRFVELVESFSARQEARLVIGKAILWDGMKIKIPPASAAWLRWLAASGGIPRVGASRADYLLHYRYYAGIEKTDNQRRHLPDPLDPEWIEEKATRLAKLAADCGITPGGEKLILREGPPGRAIYRLSLDPGNMHLVEGTC